MKSIDNCKICVVGLPLAVEFGRTLSTVGLDINEARVAELKAGKGSSRETAPTELTAAKHLGYTNEPEGIRACDVYIDKFKSCSARPDIYDSWIDLDEVWREYGINSIVFTLFQNIYGKVVKCVQVGLTVKC